MSRNRIGLSCIRARSLAGRPILLRDIRPSIDSSKAWTNSCVPRGRLYAYIVGSKPTLIAFPLRRI